MDYYQKEINNLYNTGPTHTMTYDFKLPIEYTKHDKLNDVIRQDLEIASPSIYKFILPENSLLMDKWSSIYTTDTVFLKETQKWIKNITPTVYDFHPFYQEYNDFCAETNFIDKYQYIGLKFLQRLNTSSTFLHCLGLYNLSCPLLSLLSPLFILITPFIILKIRGIPVTIQLYIDHLKHILSNTSLFKLISGFNKISFQEKSSAVVSIFIYLLQLYTNITSCMSFYRNIHRIYDFILSYKAHLSQSLKLIESLQYVKLYPSYYKFYITMENYRNKMETLYSKIQAVVLSDSTLVKIGQLGYLMNLYYDFFMNPDHNSTILYSFHLNQYNTDMISVKKLIDDKKLNACKFKKYTKMKNMYYLPHIDSAVTNDIVLKKNLAISGPNASGKTTILKSLLLNALMSQQFGYGCYKSAKIKCYDTFHSYLNIPDTSGRDSLFQAEARRCKDIIDFINKHPDKNHLCIFDELYSGTNPSDAVMCAKLYLKNMNDFKKNVDYLITTHYVELCKSFETDDRLYNMKMKVIEKDDSIEYLYKLVEGISTINGGKYILKQLDM
jgi:hypothetical protein